MPETIQDITTLGLDGVAAPAAGEIVKRFPKKGETFDPLIHMGQPFKQGNDVAKVTKGTTRRGSGRVGLKKRLERIMLRRVENCSDKRVADVIMEAGVKAAAEGDFRFWKEIMDRFEGPVSNSPLDSGSGGITVIFHQVDVNGEPTMRKVVANTADDDE